jgi:hypothetical protein
MRSHNLPSTRRPLLPASLSTKSAQRRDTSNRDGSSLKSSLRRVSGGDLITLRKALHLAYVKIQLAQEQQLADTNALIKAALSDQKQEAKRRCKAQRELKKTNSKGFFTAIWDGILGKTQSQIARSARDIDVASKRQAKSVLKIVQETNQLLNKFHEAEHIRDHLWDLNQAVTDELLCRSRIWERLRFFFGVQLTGGRIRVPELEAWSGHNPPAL